MPRHTFQSTLGVMAGILWASVATAVPPQVKITTVLDGLHNPCGLAVQPETGHVFVSDSAAGRIVRITASGHETVITGFPREAYGPGKYEQQTKFDIGPLGLAFQSKQMLIVGGGGRNDGSELVGLYLVASQTVEDEDLFGSPVDPAAPNSPQRPESKRPLTADQVEFKLGPIAAGTLSASGEGNFYGIAVNQDAIFVTCNGDDTRGWVAKADLIKGRPGKLRPFIATKVAIGVGAPVAVTLSPEGYLVIGQMGEITTPRDSRLTFYDADRGDLLSDFETGLHDIAALAYNPRTGRLYAADFAWGENAAAGGLYRLDSALANGKPAVKAVKIATLDKPAALAFAPNGVLYVAVFGTPENGSDQKPGKVLRITGDL